MNKKMIIGIGAGTAVALVILIAFFCIRISGKTNEAKAAASEFVALLQAGELEQLSLEYYTYNPGENIVYRDENGVARGQTISKQQMAAIYGVEAVKGSSKTDDSSLAEEKITKEQVLKEIMGHTKMAADVGSVRGDTAKMKLEMLIPDLKTWILNLSDDELKEMSMIESNEAFLAEIGLRVESGEITTEYKQMMIPMVKQNNKWRFQITEEMEKAFFGGLYNLFDQEETATAE